jgi:hypothetical protein
VGCGFSCGFLFNHSSLFVIFLFLCCEIFFGLIYWLVVVGKKKKKFGSEVIL